jgi:hypothetical protein
MSTTTELARAEARDKSNAAQPANKAASVQEMIDSATDAWGDAAMRQPNGASYEFFKDLLPPVRWVNAEFRDYPIVLSAPRAPQKVRLISNGGAINARANKPPMWFEQGVPIHFFVGETGEAYGKDLSRLEGPTYLDGYLPVVSTKYRAADASYGEEAFAPIDEFSAAHGAAHVRFSTSKDSRMKGHIKARIDASKSLRENNGRVLNQKGQTLFVFGPNWKWDANTTAMSVDLSPGAKAEIRVFTKPTDAGAEQAFEPFEKQKSKCVERWKTIVEEGTKLRAPEAIVNNAWRALLVANYMIVVGEKPNYSAQNAYNHLYEGECGDTLRSFLLFGHSEVGPGMLKSMLEFNRKDTQYHVAGQKLQLVAFYYWLTREATTIRDLKPLWQQSVDLILNNREKDSGLLPKDRYAGDISTKVYSLNSNANCWRGLRDLAAVLEDMGSEDEAKQLQDTAARYRRVILRAVEKSEIRDSKPPYLPIALLANEKPPEPLTASELGSYYDLICPYIIGSEIFGQGSDRENALLGYLQNHGGIGMGMMRTKRHKGENAGADGIVPLYALRYNLALLRRDEREKALVAFYGQLAQGMTRDTFVGGEGNRFLLRADADGRDFVLPPNSTSNAVWLTMLRYLLVQDWDLDEDGRPDTLRLMYAAPRAWLADGKQVRLENAPTMFGPISMEVDSKLSAGFVEVRVTPPPRAARSFLLRAPLPNGWQVGSATVDGKSVAIIGADSVDLSGQSRPVSVKFAVKTAAAAR